MRHGTARLPTISAILAAVLLAALPAAAQADDPEPLGDDYASGDFGRVRYHENGLTIDRADDEVQGEPGVNAPVFPGDTVITSQTQRAEIQLGSGTLVRVDRASQVTFLSMPDPYATIRDATVLQLTEGTMRIEAKLSEDEEFRVDTPAASIYLLGDGDFRLEVDAHGHTEVVSRRGVAEVVGNGGSVLVRSGLLTDVYPDSLPAEPSAFNTFISDNFDRWVDRRDAAYRTRERHADYDSQEVYDSLPEEVQPYYGELAGAGDWTYADEYGYVWSPSGAGADFRPYYGASWSYGPRGYFWVSNKPWGWAPYHYGRWVWIGGRGWCWTPGSVFAGAWVAWSFGSSYIGWGPLDYWNGHYSYYGRHSWTFVHYDYLHHHNYHGHRVDAHHVGHGLRGSAIVTRPPRAAPNRLARSKTARDQAFREARDRPGSMRRTTGEGRPKASFRQVESRSTPRAVANGRTGGRGAQRLPTAGTGVTGQRRPAPQPKALGVALPTESGPKIRSYLRRLTDSQSDSGRRSRVGVRTAEDSGTDRPVTPRRPTAKSGSDRTKIYNRMSSPRTTQKRSTATRSSDRREPESRSVDRNDKASSGDTKRKATASRSSTRSRKEPSGGTPSSTGSRKSSGSKSSSDGRKSGGSSSTSGDRSSGGSKSSGSKATRPNSRQSRVDAAPRRTTGSRSESQARSARSGTERPRTHARRSVPPRRPAPRASSSSSSRAPRVRPSGSRSAPSRPRARSSRRPSSRSASATPRSAPSRTKREVRSPSRPRPSRAASSSSSRPARSSARSSARSGRSSGRSSSARSGRSGNKR